MEFFLHISCEWNDQGPGTAHCTFASWRSVIRSGARPFSGSRGEDRHTSTGFPGFQDFLFRKFVASSLIPTDIRWIQLHLIFLTISATAGIQGDGETNARRRVEAAVILEAYFWIKGIVWDQLISQCSDMLAGTYTWKCMAQILAQIYLLLFSSLATTDMTLLL